MRKKRNLYGNLSAERVAKVLGMEVFIKEYQPRDILNLRSSDNKSELKSMTVQAINYQYNVILEGVGIGADTKACRERALREALSPIFNILVEVMQNSEKERNVNNPKRIVKRTWDIYIDRRDNSVKLPSGE